MDGGTITFHFVGNNSNLDKETEKAKKSLKSLDNVGEKALSTIKKVGIVSATALAGVVSASVKAYADLEQNLGGIETLFGTQGLNMKEYAESVGKTVEEIEEEWTNLDTAQADVIYNSKRAFKTAGLSANQYMETVTSFSASLIQSLGGDTLKASSYADRAIIDMSDNANKMGTSMEMIQNAYQGFSRQQYQLLDNLKLGYGGTKQEMERLIKDASKMTDIQDKLNVSVKEGDMSFGNIINAISVMQSKLKITGTTQKEAEETIIGSINSLKSSFGNFLSGAGGIKDVVDTLIIVGRNIGKVIIKMLPDIINGLVSLVNAIIPMIPTIIKKALPPLLNGLVSLLNSLLMMLPTLVQQLITTITNMIPLIIQSIMEIIPKLLENIPLFLTAGNELILGLITGLTSEKSITSIINALPTIIETLITGIMEAEPRLLLQAPRILLALATGLIKAIPLLVGKIPQIVMAIVNGFRTGIGKMGDVGGDLMKGLWGGIKGLKDWVINKVKGMGKSIINSLKKVLGIHSPSTEFAILGKFSVLGFTEQLDKMKKQIQTQVRDTFSLSPSLTGTMNNTLSPNITVNNNINLETDPLGQTVSKIKTFSGGAKNDYNYGMGA